MESFALLNVMIVGGHIATVKDPETFKANGVSHLSLRPTVATEPDDGERKSGKRIFTSVTMPKKFMSSYDQAFKENGNITIVGAMDTFTWERDDVTRMGITCNLWAEAGNSNSPMPIRTSHILTTEDPVYQNFVMITGIPVEDPLSGEMVVELEEGSIIFLHNKKTPKRNCIVPVFIAEVPDGYSEEEEFAYTALGPLGGKPLPKADGEEKSEWRDCVISDSFIGAGMLAELVGCTQGPSVPF